MATETVATDRSVGLTVLFGILCLAGAVVAFAAGLTDEQVIAGWGFAAAILAAALAVGTLHLTG